jgi:RNase H-fold protein (predicted Holliday junction resolvase)
MVILGISIGTRISGIAILDDGKLIAWNTLSFRNVWSEQKADNIINRYDAYLKEHRVKVVVFKIPPLTHQTTAIVNLLIRLQEIIARHGCMVEYRTKAEIKVAIPEARNTRDLVDYAATLYPVLAPEHSQERNIKNSYYVKMFEAVIVAHLHKTNK